MRARTLLLALAVALAATARELRVLQDARTSFYLAIAAPSSASDFVRTFNRTLSDLSQTYLAGDYPLYLRNITLLPLYIELPEDERYILNVLVFNNTSLAFLSFKVHFFVIEDMWMTFI